MKNQFLLFLSLLFSIFSYGQNSYVFDYLIEYDFQLTQTSKVEKKYVLTNSKDNSYGLYASESDKYNLNIYFRDERGIRSSFALKKSDLIKAETITLDCSLVYSQNLGNENELSNFEFEINKDTIIDSQKFQMHTLKFKDKWKSKKYDKGKCYYIIEINTDFHLPLSIFSLSFDSWLHNMEITNGIAREIFTTNRKRDKRTYIYKLVNYKKINKYIILPKECNYTLAN